MQDEQNNFKLNKIDYIDNKPVKGIQKITPNHDNLNLYLCMAIIGGRNKGKTNCCINLVKDLQRSKCVDDIYIVSTTAQNNPFYHLRVPEDNKHNVLRRDINEILEEIDSKVEDKMAIWKDIRSMSKKNFNKLYKYLYNEFEAKHDNNITEDGSKLLQYSKFNKRSNLTKLKKESEKV